MRGLRLDAAGSRLALARALAPDSPEIAVDMARQARNELEVLGDSRYYDQVLNGGDLDAVGDYFADERVAGWVRKGCFFYFQAFPDLHVALDEFVAEGDRVFLRSTMTGTHDGEFNGVPATGRHIAAESAEVFRIADGKFVGYWCMVNVAVLMQQLTEEPVAARA